MKIKKIFFPRFIFFLFSILASFLPLNKAYAHCDTLDGPVINAARKALETQNANFVLIWVKPENEDEIRKALKRAREKRRKAKTKEEKEKADMEFFETLVRIHREGEGAKYEGIKPAGSVESEIALADKATKTGRLDEVLKKISSEHTRKTVEHLFREMKDKSHYQIDDVVSGRQFIKAYIKFIHTVEKAIKGQEISDEDHHH